MRLMEEATENLERTERDALAASYMSPASREQYLEAQWALQDATRWWREVAKWARLRDAAGAMGGAADEHEALLYRAAEPWNRG